MSVSVLSPLLTLSRCVLPALLLTHTQTRMHVTSSSAGATALSAPRARPTGFSPPGLAASSDPHSD